MYTIYTPPQTQIWKINHMPRVIFADKIPQLPAKSAIIQRTDDFHIAADAERASLDALLTSRLSGLYPLSAAEVIALSPQPEHALLYVTYYKEIIGALLQQPMAVDNLQIPSMGFVAVDKEFERLGFG